MPAKEGLGARGRAAEPRQGMRGGFWRAFLKREAGVCAGRSVDELWTGNALRIVSRLWKCTGMRDFERAEEKSDVREFLSDLPEHPGRSCAPRLRGEHGWRALSLCPAL